MACSVKDLQKFVSFERGLFAKVCELVVELWPWEPQNKNHKVRTVKLELRSQNYECRTLTSEARAVALAKAVSGHIVYATEHGTGLLDTPLRHEDPDVIGASRMWGYQACERSVGER